MNAPVLAALSILFCVAWLLPRSAEAKPSAGAVANINVVSDKVKDVSSLEAWKASYIRDDMTDKEKALACWESLVAHQHQDRPPLEYLHRENVVHDAVKMFNVYGYSFCSVVSNQLASLARYVGLEARIFTISRHVVCEIQWEGEWHMLDASLINYFPKPGGDIASVQEILDAVKGWYDKHPDFLDEEGHGIDAKLREYYRAEGKAGWKRGPELLANSPFYDARGWLPARTHAWYSTMQEYDGSTLFPYEGGYSLGYRVNIQLRPGERLVRNWSNKGLHVNMDHDEGPRCMTMTGGDGHLAYAAKYGDIAPGRVGNGERSYRPPATSLPLNAWRFENLGVAGEAIAVEHDGEPGVLEIRMPSSYIYLGGGLAFELASEGGMGEGGMEVLVSDNHGRDWKPVYQTHETGSHKVDLTPQVFRRYDFLLRFVLTGEAALSGIDIRSDIQHSQAALPALTEGENNVTFTAGLQEGRLTLEGSTDPANKGKQLVVSDYHPDIEHLAADNLVVEDPPGAGQITYAVDTPSDITGVGVFTFYRARDPRGGWDVQISFDGGKTFSALDTCLGPTPHSGSYVTTRDVPAASTSARIRWVGRSGGNATAILNHRIDVDYRLPEEDLPPVKITYTWDEDGVERENVHVARIPRDDYSITCGQRPVMKSIVLELAE